MKEKEVRIHEQLEKVVYKECKNSWPPTIDIESTWQRHIYDYPNNWAP